MRSSLIDRTAAAIVPVRSWVVLFNVARTRCRVRRVKALRVQRHVDGGHSRMTAGTHIHRRWAGWWGGAPAPTSLQLTVGPHRAVTVILTVYIMASPLMPTSQMPTCYP